MLFVHLRSARCGRKRYTILVARFPAIRNRIERELAYEMPARYPMDLEVLYLSEVTMYRTHCVLQGFRAVECWA